MITQSEVSRIDILVSSVSFCIIIQFYFYKNIYFFGIIYKSIFVSFLWQRSRAITPHINFNVGELCKENDTFVFIPKKPRG